MSGLSGLTSLFTSPRDRLQTRLEDAISGGKIKSADKDALSGALDDIDKSMQQAAKSDTGKSPADMIARLKSLIDDKVKAGKLTEDQAAELRAMFETDGKGRGEAALKAFDKSFDALAKDGILSAKDAAAVKKGLAEVRKLFAALGPSSNGEDQAFLFTRASAVVSGLMSDNKLTEDQAKGVMKTLVAAKNALGSDGGGPDFEALAKLTPKDVGGDDTAFAGLRYGAPASDKTIADFVSKLVDDVNSLSFNYDTKGKNKNDSWPLLLDFQA